MASEKTASIILAFTCACAGRIEKPAAPAQPDEQFSIDATCATMWEGSAFAVKNRISIHGAQAIAFKIDPAQDGVNNLTVAVDKRPITTGLHSCELSVSDKQKGQGLYIKCSTPEGAEWSRNADNHDIIVQGGAASTVDFYGAEDGNAYSKVMPSRAVCGVEPVQNSQDNENAGVSAMKPPKP